MMSREVQTCKICGMIFIKPVEGIRTTHHLWRFHNDVYKEGLRKCYEVNKDIYKKHGSFNTLDELLTYSELELINYDIQMEEMTK